MKFDPATIEGLVKEYSSLTRLLIGLGFDAAKALRALFGTRPELTVEQQDAILVAVLADASVREALALKDAGEATD